MDHCHRTGEFRGWLCGDCNRALGKVSDDPSTLRRMAESLELAIDKAVDCGHTDGLTLYEIVESKRRRGLDYRADIRAAIAAKSHAR